jgi:hypothetical protein
MFWVVTRCSPVKASTPFGRTYRLNLQDSKSQPSKNKHEADIKQSSKKSLVSPNDTTLYPRRLSSSAMLKITIISLLRSYANTSMLCSHLDLKMKAVCSSKASANFYQTWQRHLPEDSAIYCHCHENPEQHSLPFMLLVNIEKCKYSETSLIRNSRFGQMFFFLRIIILMIINIT